MIICDHEHHFAYEMIGEFHSRGSWIHPARVIQSYELILVLEGTLYIAEEGEEYILHPNEIFFLEPGKHHAGYQENTEPVAFYWFHFRTNLPLPCKLCRGTDCYEVKALLKRLLHITNTASYSKLAADAAGLLIYEELLQLGKETDEAGNLVLANKIAEYIRINLKNNITVASVAAHFNYHPDYISKLFKKNFRVGIKEWITAQKLKLAKDMLLTTSYTVRQIASVLGYTQENLFIKFFLYHEKISPSRFRQNFYNTHMNNK